MDKKNSAKFVHSYILAGRPWSLKGFSTHICLPRTCDVLHHRPSLHLGRAALTRMPVSRCSTKRRDFTRDSHETFGLLVFEIGSPTFGVLVFEICVFVGHGGALVESIAFNRRVVGSTPALSRHVGTF